jgi:hypothetical protein
LTIPSKNKKSWDFPPALFAFLNENWEILFPRPVRSGTAGREDAFLACNSFQRLDSASGIG